MWTIFKKELKSYFLSPIGYVVIGVLLLMFTIFFYTTTVDFGLVYLTYMYQNGLVWGLIIAVPLLTMRTFSEERKTGTEQLILTSPISMVSVVLGKFFAALSVIIVALLISFMYLGIISYFGTPSIPVLLISMLGFVLVSGAAISIGMLASSLTESQVISGIITIGFLILSLFLPDVGPEFPDISVLNFYNKFPYGVISLSELVGVISFTAMFIAFTIIVMQRRKLVK